MTRFTSLLLTALIACPLVVTLPLAQSAAQEAPLAAGQPTGEPVPFSDEPSLLYATELMQRAELYAWSIAQLTEVPEVEALEVSALPRADASPEVFVDTINRFLSYYSDDIAALRSAMEGNPVVADALEAAGVQVSNVVAAEIRPDLALRVYIRDW